MLYNCFLLVLHAAPINSSTFPERQDAGPIVQCADPPGASNSFQQVGRFLGLLGEQISQPLRGTALRFLCFELRSLPPSGFNNQGRHLMALHRSTFAKLHGQLNLVLHSMCRCRAGPGCLHCVWRPGNLELNVNIERSNKAKFMAICITCMLIEHISFLELE